MAFETIAQSAVNTSANRVTRTQGEETAMATAKRHSLTTLGDRESPSDRRHRYRRDANCAVLLLYRNAGTHIFRQRQVWLSNICEDGALLVTEGIVDPVEETFLVLPGMRAKARASVLRQGVFTLAVNFATALPTALVDRIARLEPRPAAPVSSNNFAPATEDARKPD
ncbi:hypothetical protein [Pararhizobium mangrovi]|uniref:PilZ domain-containing protein n=1 Tax=Pararhizobium mangrovi TaxID=2590452 RepID=A0A506U2X8_9HYPH|nr:hypothetical protein [Pararhizobium mangrovi]TPW26939.1 hypothetical protein FJU11_13305 [Pararhizobium mangrovi]